MDDITAKTASAEGLMKQLSLLNQVQEQNLSGAWEWKEGSAHFFWTDSLFELYGLPAPPDNLISTYDVANLVIPEEQSLFIQKMGELQLRHQVDFYYKIITPDEKIRRIRNRAFRATVQEGVVFRGSCTDETAENELLQPLRDRLEQQQLQLKIFETAEIVAGIGSWQINLETFETVYSNNVYRIYGLQPGSVPAHVDSFRRFIHLSDRDIVLRTQEKSYVEMMPLHLEYRIIRADGELRYIRQVSHLQRNSAGEHILFGSTGDITEQKLLEIQLRETNEALQLRNELFAQAEDIGKMGTWQVNLNTRKTICCEHHYRLYGIKPYSVSAALENFLSFVHPDDRDIITDLYHDVYEEFVPADIDFRIIRPDGKVRTIRQRCKLIQTLENERLITGVIQDITLQEQKDRQLKESYEKLAVQNETFRQAEKVAAMGSWTWNLDTGVLSFSENMYHIYGARPQVLEPRMEALVEFIHPEDRKRLKNLPERIRKATEPLSEVYRIVRSDGEVRHLCSRSQRFTSPQGKAIIIGTLQDITEEEQLQEQSKERVAFARMLADTMVDRIIITDQSNNIVSWNKSSEQIFGRRKEEVAGKNFFDVFPQLRIPSVMDRFKQALAGQTVHVASLATITMPGYHELLMVPFKNVSGRVTGIMSVLHDVTRQHQLQQQLAERVQFSETLIDSSVDRVFSIDTEQRLLTWNSKCEEAYGLPRNKVIGKKLADVFPEAVSRPDLMEPVLKALQGETTYVPARESVYTDGMVESYFIPLKNAAGNVYGVLSIVRDVTERIRAEQYMHQLNQSLQEKNRALEEMNEELTSFAFVASHDLREPLRKIQIFSDWINQREATQLSEEGKDRFNRIRAAVHRMDTLIDDILSFSRINSNSRQLVVFDPNQVLENVKTDLNERIARSKAVIHVDPLPAMKGNPTHFYQLLLNLINNALKYQHPGNQPYVRITCERLKGEEIDNAAAEKASTYFKITVADNGIGFEPQYAKKIFQMFQRLHGMHEYPGTGMGLAICRKIMKKHRGFITAAGKPGEGAVFSCYFHAG